MRKLILFFSIILLAVACKKNQSPTPAAATAAYTINDYMPLKYGNYWVYQLTVTDTNGIVQTTMIDSCYIKDSVLAHGKWFYTLTGFNSNFSQQNCIDSAGFIISEYGTKTLGLINNDTLSKESYNSLGTWYNMYYIMKTLPLTTYTFNSKTYPNCISRYCYFYSNMNAYCPNRILYNIHSPGVGIVYANYCFSSNCNVWETKLLRYKIN